MAHPTNFLYFFFLSFPNLYPFTNSTSFFFPIKHPYRIKFETWILGLIERQKLWPGEILRVAVGEPRTTEQRKTTLRMNLLIFTKLRPIGHHGSFLCLWLLILLFLLLPCTSTIVRRITSVSKVAAWPSSLEGSPSNLCRRIRCLVLLLQRKFTDLFLFNTMCCLFDSFRFWFC